MVVFCLVPLYYCVLKLADSVKITVNLLRAVYEEQALGPVFVIGERRHLRRFCECYRLPLDPLDEPVEV